MSTVLEWRLVGDWFDICSCDLPCPCEFAQAPTNNACEGMLAWHVREGHYGDVRLDGLNLLALAAFEGNAGPAKAEVSRVSSSTSGLTGGSVRPCRPSCGPGGRMAGQLRCARRRVQRRGIRADHLRSRRRPRLLAGRDPGAGDGAAEALTGPTTPPGQRVQMINPPGSEVGPGESPLGAVRSKCERKASASNGPAKAAPASISRSIGPAPAPPEDEKEALVEG